MSDADTDLLHSDVEEDLRATVRALLADRCPPEAVAAMYDGDRFLVAPLWAALASDLGLAGLLVPEAVGGAGASAREAAVVLEELGRSVAPAPFLTSAVVATTVLADAATDLTRRLAAGTTTAALVVRLSLSPTDPVPSLHRDEAGGITGSVTSVAGALEADVLLVPVSGDHGIDVAVVEAAAADVAPVSSLDMSRQLADVTLTGATGELVLPPGAGEEAIRRGLRLGAALLASEQLGLARWCLDGTVAYLKDRRQFGRVVGGFQALKHRLADLYTDVEPAAATARHAAVAAATGGTDAAVATAVAQAWCSDVAVRAAEEALQLHGGLGMTWEHPVHLYLKRAKADQIAFGSPGAHRRHLGTLVDLAPPVH